MSGIPETIDGLFITIRGLESERDKLKASLAAHIQMKNDAIAEVNRLQAKLRQGDIRTSDEGTSYCASCEHYARQNEAMRKALEKITKHCQTVMPRGAHLMGVYLIAKQALSNEAGG